MSTLFQTLEYLSSYALDDKIYWRVEQLYTKEVYEITLNYPGHWNVKKLKDKTWNSYELPEIIDALNKLKIDLVNFHELVLDKIAEQVAGSTMIIEAAREKFGDEFVDQAVEGYKKFHMEMIDAIDQVLKEKQIQDKKPKLTLVPNEDK